MFHLGLCLFGKLLEYLLRLGQDVRDLIYAVEDPLVISQVPDSQHILVALKCFMKLWVVRLVELSYPSRQSLAQLVTVRPEGYWGWR